MSERKLFYPERFKTVTAIDPSPNMLIARRSKEL
jgi:hypothetical protein